MLDMLISKPSSAGSEKSGRRIPSWGEAYVRYRPLLFSALSKLSSRGYTTAPDDGQDLIHDFFLEAWPGIAANYDPAKAKLETYLYGSFVQFARPRIVRQHRWREALVNPTSFADLSTPDLQVVPSPYLYHDLSAVRAVALKLPAFEQAILAAYLSDARSSERDIARHFSVTRYQLRLHLADTLGKIAVALDEMSAMSAAERAVMVTLWREGRTVKEAARILQIATSEIQAMRVKLFEMLSAAVSGAVRNKSFEDTGSLMETAADGPHVEQLLLSITNAETQQAALGSVEEHKDLIFEFLGGSAAEAFFARHSEVFTPEILTQLYSALGYQGYTDPADAALIEAFFDASEQDEKEIGQAFSEVLIPNLHDELASLHMFQGASRVGAGQRDELLSQTSVRFGGAKAAELAQYGITPVTIVEATQAVANLARRFCDRSGVEKGQHFILDKVEKAEGYSLKAVLTRDVSVREIVLMCEIDEETARRLFDWLARVVEYAPSLFDGFETELWGDELRVTRTDKSVSNLFQRWWHPPPAIAA